MAAEPEQCDAPPKWPSPACSAPDSQPAAAEQPLNFDISSMHHSQHGAQASSPCATNAGGGSHHGLWSPDFPPDSADCSSHSLCPSVLEPLPDDHEQPNLLNCHWAAPLHDDTLSGESLQQAEQPLQVQHNLAHALQQLIFVCYIPAPEAAMHEPIWVQAHILKQNSAAA